MRKGVLVSLSVLAVSLPITAQDPATGFPPFGSFEDGRFDVINRQNLNVNIGIPIVSSPGRGLDFAFSVVHDSLAWKKVGAAWVPKPGYGWKTSNSVGSITWNTAIFECQLSTWGYYEEVDRYSNYKFTDSSGTIHSFSLSFYDWDPGCGYVTGPRTGFATDGSGFYLDATDPTFPIVYNTSGIAVSSFSTMTDTNGNFISRIIFSSTETHWKDTLGRITLKIKVVSPILTEYHVLDSQSSSYQIYRLRSQPYDIRTNFQCAGATEYTANGVNLPYELELPLPGNPKYQFEYENNTHPSYPGKKTGRLAKIILPTGGFYQYSYPDPNNGINCTDATAKSMTRIIHDGTNSVTWTFARTQVGSDWKTTITAPKLSYDSVGNVATFTFNSSGRQISQKIYQGTEIAGNLRRTVNTTWAVNNTPSSTTVILEDNSKQSKVETVFDSYRNLTELREYDWGTGAPGSAIRTTAFSYLSTSAYTARNIRDRMTSKVVRQGGVAGPIKYRVDIGYDGPAFTGIYCITSVAQHNDGSYGCPHTARGNPTAVTTYNSPAGPSGGITKTFTYDSLGNLRKADVNCCQQKQWNYSAATQYAYPDSVVHGPAAGPQLSTSFQYNFNTGLLTRETDANGQETDFIYDVHKRLTQIERSDGALITYTYVQSASERSVAVESPVQGTDRTKTKTYFDGLGRAFRLEVSDSGGGNCSSAKTEYDALSRPFKRFNPVSCGASFTHSAETRFDALGRPTKSIAQDAQEVTYAYSLNTATTTDPTGKQRKSESDAAGRLSKLYEPDVNSGNSLTQISTYSYDVLDALATVAQGAQTRSYSYDGHGRLTAQTTPEAGTWSYLYNTFGLITRRTDARSVDTNYTYDALNRLKTVSYDVSGTSVPATSTVEYFYDEGGAAANALGRLTRVTVGGVNDEIYQYDQLGRVKQVQKVISGTTYATAYGYNLAGEATSLTYPSGRVVTQSYDTVGRLSAIQSGGTSYASGFGYNAANQVTASNYGNGVAASFGYTAERLQLQNLTYSKAGQSLLSLSYCYWQNCDTQSGGNNGQITRITDNVVAGRTVNYAYDALHRLKTAVTVGGGGYNQWGLSWTYDRYGNRTNQTQTAGSPPSASMAISATTNRVTEAWAQYDANGNMLNDGANTLAYDAENRVTSAAGATYSYDGAGLRVKKVPGGSTTVYIYSGSQVIAEYDGAVNLKTEYTYVGGQRLAEHPAGATNGGFENGLQGWFGSGYQLVTDAAKAHSGSNYLQLSTAGPGVWIMNSQAVAVAPGQQVTFGGWAYRQSGTGGYVGWRLVIYDASGVAFQWIWTTPGDVSLAQWTYQVRTYTMPAGAASVKLYSEIWSAPGAVVARFDDGFLSSGTRYFHHDHLSLRLVTDASGNIVAQSGHYPYGESWYETGGANKLKFTSYERDSETGNDYAMFRSHIPRLGRFNRPDPIAGSTANPQSLNRYAYVANDPLNRMDPSGLVTIQIDDVRIDIIGPGIGVGALGTIFGPIWTPPTFETGYGGWGACVFLPPGTPGCSPDPGDYIIQDWSPDAHDEIFRNALRPCGVSDDEISQIQQGSRWFDKISQSQAWSNAHAMLNGTAQSQAQANRGLSSFRDITLTQAQNQWNAGARNHALFSLGVAMHGPSDSTSPAHRTRDGDLIPWCGASGCPGNRSQVLRHSPTEWVGVEDEITLTMMRRLNPDSFAGINAAIRQAFEDVTGRKLSCSDR